MSQLHVAVSLPIEAGGEPVQPVDVRPYANQILLELGSLSIAVTPGQAERLRDKLTEALNLRATGWKQ
ncbi:hypothetical protein [Pseudonocardia sp. WMMC193]|uniref:hypothetical protein n=1 Tax=Pseudonocardia sp. WMMC193 TaxID=2911965 RepID=UPI001F3AD9ED|nr:hypothetical protein [Pseudonocardia sp. WMMC193]MCF7548925.1 hypothetical protein [Pseudonocardia sp. WMMC193]